MLPSMNESQPGRGNRQGSKLKKNRSFERKPNSLCHLPLSYSFMEGTNDAPLHE